VGRAMTRGVAKVEDKGEREKRAGGGERREEKRREEASLFVCALSFYFSCSLLPHSAAAGSALLWPSLSLFSV
jgi:hypothetical protein